MPSHALNYVNLGCGNHYHPDWINIDIVATGPDVRAYDLSRGIPLPDASCAVVYHAAMLEHMRRADVLAFLQECHRVLQPGGIMRVGVPDLEKICQLYLRRLAAVMGGDEDPVHDYDWIMLELFDQTVRETSGGEMLSYLRQDPLSNEEFVFERIGEEGRHLVKELRSQHKNKHVSKTALFQKMRVGLLIFPLTVKRFIVRGLFGAGDKRAFDIGRFRLSGEVHHWMYDQYSLARLLIGIGFCDPQLQEAGTSCIPEWSRFHLDTLPDGQTIKPDLFFMEAVKPETLNEQL